MEHDVFAQIGYRHIADLNPPDILALIRKVEARGALDVLRRIRQSIGAVFRYAIAEGWRETNPAADIGAVSCCRFGGHAVRLA
jgi:site-specific recombinase XerD